MALDHKAFVLDEAAFRSELAPLLIRTLRDASLAELEAFIDRERASLKDPYEGGPLGEDWKSTVETHDAQTYGDYALTKYYDPDDDVGLSAEWESAEELIDDAGLESGDYLGGTLGKAPASFDPGKQGSYFQSSADVVRNLRKLREVLGERDEIEEALTAVEEMLAAAGDEGKGLYVTF